MTVNSITEKLQLFQELNPKNTQWVVSDLKSRAYLERERLTRDQFVEANGIIRARDLWTQLTERYFPEYRILHDGVMELRLRHFLDEQFVTADRAGQDIDWAKRPGAHKTLLKYLSYLMPVLNSPQALPAVREWFAADSQRLVRWGHWFIAAAEAWVVSDKDKLLTPGWLSGFLAHRLPSRLQKIQAVETRKLYFDFGPELLPGESDLIEALSEFFDVVVIVPSAAWQLTDRSLFKSYQRLESAAKERKPYLDSKLDRRNENGDEPLHSYRRFSSMLAEVKDATAEVRAWLDAGIEARQIAILAADIGLYWPVLEPHLRVEGVPVDRAVTVPLQTLPDFQKWLARLRMATRDFDQSDLEFEWTGRFSDFERTFNRFYDRDDIQRNPTFAGQVESLATLTRAADQELISFSIFCERAEVLWPSPQSLFALELLLQDLQKQNAPAVQLAFSDWVRIMEGASSNLEQTVVVANLQGIACLDISSAEYFTGTHIYIMGLSEDALRREQSLHVLDRDVVELSSSTGFDLPFPATRQLEWELPWFLNTQRSSVILSFPESNFDGSPSTPAICWLKGSFRDQSTHVRRTPLPTRWDQLQVQPVDTIGLALDWGPDYNSHFSSAFLREIEKRQYPLWQFTDWQTRLRRISPSLLQTYSNCPFITLTERVWGQSDLPDLDLDLDVMTRGKLLHRVFENLLESHILPQLSLEHVEQIVRQSMDDIEMQIGEPKLKLSMERRIARIALEFLEREREWRKLYPQTRTVARELSVDGWINIQTGELYAEPPAGANVMIFKGQIDRVDEDDQHRILILDYKSSAGGLNSHNLWLKNNQLQLGLYMESVYQKMTQPPLVSSEIVGAQYFVMKDFSRTRGLVMTGDADALICVSTRSKARMSKDEFEKFRMQLREHVGQLFRRMEQGEWIPNPRDPNACPDCQWRGLCRAPHLL